LYSDTRFDTYIPHLSVKVFVPHIQVNIGIHLACKIESIRIDVGDDDVTRAGVFADRNRHAADRAGTGDEHVFADEIEREGGVNGVAERIETRKDIERNRPVRLQAMTLR